METANQMANMGIDDEKEVIIQLSDEDITEIDIHSDSVMCPVCAHLRPTLKCPFCGGHGQIPESQIGTLTQNGLARNPLWRGNIRDILLVSASSAAKIPRVQSNKNKASYNISSVFREHVLRVVGISMDDGRVLMVEPSTKISPLFPWLEIPLRSVMSTTEVGIDSIVFAYTTEEPLFDKDDISKFPHMCVDTARSYNDSLRIKHASNEEISCKDNFGVCISVVIGRICGNKAYIVDMAPSHFPIKWVDVRILRQHGVQIDGNIFLQVSQTNVRNRNIFSYELDGEPNPLSIAVRTRTDTIPEIHGISSSVKLEPVISAPKEEPPAVYPNSELFDDEEMGYCGIYGPGRYPSTTPTYGYNRKAYSYNRIEVQEKITKLFDWEK